MSGRAWGGEVARHVVEGGAERVECWLLTGLPQRYQDSVRAIQPGLPLFLYNYSTRCLHGVFEVRWGRGGDVCVEVDDGWGWCGGGCGSGSDLAWEWCCCRRRVMAG